MAENGEVQETGNEEILRIISKLQYVAERGSLNYWELFKSYDPHETGIVSDVVFSAVMQGLVMHFAGLNVEDIKLLTEYYEDKNTHNVSYREFCKTVHKYDQSTTKPYVTGLEWETEVGIPNQLTEMEEQLVQEILNKMAERVILKELDFAVFFQEYEVGTKNAGSITIPQFSRILGKMDIFLLDKHFSLLVKKFCRYNYTIDYIGFNSALNNTIHRTINDGLYDYWRAVHRQAYPIGPVFQKYVRPDIGVKNPKDIFKDYIVTHPSLERVEEEEKLIDVLKRIQKYIFAFSIRLKEFFQTYDKHNTGRMSQDLFRRGLDSIGVNSTQAKLRLTPDEIRRVVKLYTTISDEVLWRVFVEDIESVFVPSRLIKYPSTEMIPYNPTPEVRQLHRRGSQRPLLKKSDCIKCESILFFLKKKLKAQDIFLMNFFQPFDRHRNGHCTLAQFRAVLSSNKINDISNEEINEIEKRYADSEGFNYRQFLLDVGETPTKRMDMRHLATLEDKSKPVVDIQLSYFESDNIEDVLRKLKRATVERQIRLKDFMEQYDPLRRRIITRLQFTKAIRSHNYPLTLKELQVIMDVFASPFQKDYVDYIRFLTTLDEIYTQPNLERAPLLTPIQHISFNDGPHNFLTKEEKEVLGKALDKISGNISQHDLIMFYGFDLRRKGTVSFTQFLRALDAMDSLVPLNRYEQQILFKAFRRLNGTNVELDYRLFIRSMEFMHRQKMSLF